MSAYVAHVFLNYIINLEILNLMIEVKVHVLVTTTKSENF